MVINGTQKEGGQNFQPYKQESWNWYLLLSQTKVLSFQPKDETEKIK